MKIKNKLILAATSMLVLSGVAAGTSTFAWYTANSRVEFDLTNIAAQSETTSLDVEYVESPRNVWDDPSTTELDEGGIDGFASETDPNSDPGNAAALTFGYTGKLTDVSSIGDGNFVKPIWDNDGGTDSTDSVGFWTDEADYEAEHEGIVWYHEFTLKFTAGGTGGAVALYLSPNTSKTFVSENTTNGGDLTVEDSVRFSAVDTSSGDQIFLANPNGNAEESFIASDATVAAESDVNTVKPDLAVLDNSSFFGNANGGTNFASSDFVSGNANTGEILYSDVEQSGYLGEMDPTGATDDDKSTTVTFYTWIEGTDIDTVADATDFFGEFDMKLSFYTLDIGAMPDGTNS